MKQLDCELTYLTLTLIDRTSGSTSGWRVGPSSTEVHLVITAPPEGIGEEVEGVGTLFELVSRGYERAFSMISRSSRVVEHRKGGTYRSREEQQSRPKLPCTFASYQRSQEPSWQEQPPSWKT